jgi:hypothetical protein
MASGVNTTFRQIGIATGIAVYGSIFASSLQHKLGHAVAGTPGLRDHLSRVVGAIQQGNAAQAVGAVAKPLRGPLVAAIHASFASTLDVLLVVSAVLALVGAASALVLIRPRDLVASGPGRPTPGQGQPATLPAGATPPLPAGRPGAR